MSQHITSDLTASELSAHWQDYTPGNGKLELAFAYNGKDRSGIIEKITESTVTLLMERDGDASYKQTDRQFKSFTIANIAGEIDVFKRV